MWVAIDKLFGDLINAGIVGQCGLCLFSRY